MVFKKNAKTIWRGKQKTKLPDHLQKAIIGEADADVDEAKFEKSFKDFVGESTDN